MDMKIHMYVVISLKFQNKNKKRKITHLMIQYARDFMTLYAHLNNVPPTTNIINSKYTNGQIIRFTIEGGLDLPMLLNTSGQARIFPNIKHSLVSIVALCDASCTVTFKIKYVTVF